MNGTIKSLGAMALAALIALGASACGHDTSSTPSTPPTRIDPSQLTGSKAADTVRSFVAASTSDQVAADVATKATAATFAPAVKLIDKGTPAATVQNTVSDFVLVKMADPKAPVTVTLDDSKVGS